MDDSVDACFFPLCCNDMSGRKRRDRSLTMDELLRQSQAATRSGDPIPTPGIAQPSSMASPSRPSTSHASPSTAPPSPSQPVAADTQIGLVTTGPSTSRGRGHARGIRTWNSGHLIDVAFDETYHPVGVHARQLIGQLGHMVRDPRAFPLTTLDWEAFPVEQLDRIWTQVKDNLRACPELFRPVCMSKCRKMWKDHKNKMKMQHWKPHQDAPVILERVPDPTGILPDQWTQLVRYWTSEEANREADRNARNRALQGPAHRLGTRHITQVCHELRSKGDPVGRMSVWMLARDHGHPEVAAILYQSLLEQLPEDQHSLPSWRVEIFYSIVGRDGHEYTLTYGTGIPRSHIARAESSGASSSQGLSYRINEQIEELLQSMKATIREEVRAEMRAEMAELEARLSQSRGPLSSDPPPTTQAPDAGSSHRARHDSAGEGTHDLAGSIDPDQGL